MAEKTHLATLYKKFGINSDVEGVGAGGVQPLSHDPYHHLQPPKSHIKDGGRKASSDPNATKGNSKYENDQN